MQNFIKLGISIGDPNGIGPEIILKALTEKGSLNDIIPIIYSELEIIEFYLNNFHKVFSSFYENHNEIFEKILFHIVRKNILTYFIIY